MLHTSVTFGSGVPAMETIAQLNSSLEGRYVIEREIGHGGMATVFLARDIRHDRHVALKLLKPELGAALGVERFQSEIRVTANLQHPNLLPLFDSGEANGLLFYVMPFVDGESLRTRLDREKQLPVDEAIRIAVAIARALHHAHQHGVIHRDLKPENILLQAGQPVIADFGIALPTSKAGDARITQTGLALGTPHYMSPEQAMGDRDLDGRSDVYGLACVLYEMLAGEPPHTGPNAQAVIFRRLTDSAPHVRRLRDAVPANIEQALIKALARAPADRFVSAAAFAEALTAPATVRTKPQSVAVLPFSNFSADPENEYFADGITEDVIAQLSKIRALKVISSTSVMALKNRDRNLREIGASLGVATLLEGSVRRAGDRVRIVAQLIDAETDDHLWADTYDRQLTDIFAIQTDVALQIANALTAQLSRDERSRLQKAPTRDFQAYQLHLQGRHYASRFTQHGLWTGIGYYRQAIAKDADYALAYASMAWAYAELAQMGIGVLRPAEAYLNARNAVTRALELDSGLGEAHCISAYLKCLCDFDWAGAEAEFRISLELDPGNADTCDLYGQMLGALERYDEALVMVKRAQELDPLAHRTDVANTLLRAGRYEEGLRAITPVIELDPHNPRAHATFGWALLRTGKSDAGLAALQKAVSLGPDETLYLAQLGEAYALTGRTAEAHDVLRQLKEWSGQRYVSPYHTAYVHTGLGQPDAALDLLERAFDEQSGPLYAIKGSYLFAALRQHPRFTALLRKMNLA
jgi:serine/threonine protein kinase/Tfp pilus assembly protein PilF